MTRGVAARWLAVTATVAISVTACDGGSQPHVQSPPTSSSTNSPVTSPTASATVSVDPRAQPALAAYLAFSKAVNNAQRKPPAVSARTYPPAADFTKFSFDPIRGQEVAYVLYLSQHGYALRGTPPTPQPSVVSVDMQATPYPTVVLTDCKTTPPTWQQYDVKSGREIPDPYKTRTPLRTRIQVIYYEKHWGVYKIDHLTGQKCGA